MIKRFKILLVAGARPNFMKVAPIYNELRKHKRFKTLIVHTGQHYDRDMSDVFFRDLGLPKPDIYLGVGSASHAVQTARIMEKFEPVCLKHKPDLVIVVGDVNSTIACALTAVKLDIKVAHVEAGLRSFDRTMPEEINRMLTDQISDYLFTTCRDGDKNLIREGIPRNKIYFVGNTMIDSLRNSIPVIKRKMAVIKDNKIREIVTKPYALVTLHRPSNVDDVSTFRGIWKALGTIAKKMPVIFPVHPRTLKMIKKYISISEYQSGAYQNIRGSGYHCTKQLILTPPLGYMEFMSLMANAALVLTDSGGIQEETTILGIPCLTLRHNTERPITITQGTNKLVGTDPRKIIREAMKIIKVYQVTSRSVSGDQRTRISGKPKRPNRQQRLKKPKFWDGKAALRIVDVLLKK
jgi:UDP-N-acetylglucosamine 2-epimerase (non-hydrolysing)